MRVKIAGTKKQDQKNELLGVIGLNVLKSIIYALVLSLFSAIANARSDLEFSDFEGHDQSWALFAALGIFGAIKCHFHSDLVEQHSNTVRIFLKWLFYIALTLLAIPIIGNLFGFSSVRLNRNNF